MENGRVPYIHRHHHEPKNPPPVRLWTLAELAANGFRCGRCGGRIGRSAYVEECASCVACGESHHLVREERNG